MVALSNTEFVSLVGIGSTVCHVNIYKLLFIHF